MGVLSPEAFAGRAIAAAAAQTRGGLKDAFDAAKEASKFDPLKAALGETEDLRWQRVLMSREAAKAARNTDPAERDYSGLQAMTKAEIAARDAREAPGLRNTVRQEPVEMEEKP